MLRRSIRAALALALLATGAAGQTYQDPAGKTIIPGVLPLGQAYKFGPNISAAGSYTALSVSSGAASNVVGGSYIFSCVAATWNSATAQLQTLGPDGSTYVNVGTALTANGTQGVVIGANATVQIVVTGTPTNLNCNLT